MSAYVKRLADYDIERLTEAVDAMFTASAFYGRIKPHMTVILKPNLVMRSACWWRKAAAVRTIHLS